MGASTPQEEAIGKAALQWRETPAVRQRVAQIGAILGTLGVTEFNADGLTMALQANIELERHNPIGDVTAWMTEQRMWPFDREEVGRGQDTAVSNP